MTTKKNNHPLYTVKEFNQMMGKLYVSNHWFKAWPATYEDPPYYTFIKRFPENQVILLLKKRNGKRFRGFIDLWFMVPGETIMYRMQMHHSTVPETGQTFNEFLYDFRPLVP